MSVEANKTLARRFFEDAPYHPDVCDQIFAANFQFHTIDHVLGNPSVDSTPQDEKDAYERHRSIWGDWQTTIEDMIAEGDRVMVRWTHHGTQEAEYHGLPPTGKQISWSGLNIFRIVDGRIAEVWNISDRLWVWQQLGVLPEIKGAIAKAREAMLSQESSQDAGSYSR